MPTYRSRVELFRRVGRAQVCGINQGHSAARLILQGDEGLVTLICLEVAIPIAAKLSSCLPPSRPGGEAGFEEVAGAGQFVGQQLFVGKQQPVLADQRRIRQTFQRVAR
jgi:hypothetical protein